SPYTTTVRSRSRPRTGQGHRGHRVTVDQLTSTRAEPAATQHQHVTVGLAPVIGRDRQRPRVHRQGALGVGDVVVAQVGIRTGHPLGRRAWRSEARSAALAAAPALARVTEATESPLTSSPAPVPNRLPPSTSTSP